MLTDIRKLLAAMKLKLRIFFLYENFRLQLKPNHRQQFAKRLASDLDSDSEIVFSRKKKIYRNKLMYTSIENKIEK